MLLTFQCNYEVEKHCRTVQCKSIEVYFKNNSNKGTILQREMWRDCGAFAVLVTAVQEFTYRFVFTQFDSRIPINMIVTLGDTLIVQRKENVVKETWFLNQNITGRLESRGRFLAILGIMQA